MLEESLGSFGPFHTLNSGHFLILFVFLVAIRISFQNLHFLEEFSCFFFFGC
jgi:hypothetical protein